MNLIHLLLPKLPKLIWLLIKGNLRGNVGGRIRHIPDIIVLHAARSLSYNAEARLGH